MKTLTQHVTRFATAAAVVAITFPAQAQVAAHQGLTLDGAKSVAAAASAEARRLGAGGAIAVVDEGGNLVYIERLENTFPAATTVAIEKARTAATFRKPTRDFENAIAKGRVSLVAVSAMTPLQGGIPITVGNQIVGAVGVSGAMSAQQDDEIATVAAGALSAGASTTTMPTTAMAASTAASSESVTFIPAAKTMAAFAKGQPLIETGSYKVHASRREVPGGAEVHTRDTDVIYVLDGTAVIVTGGTVVDGKTIATDEIRGARIDGGTPQALAKGDVLIVPNGVPHWFKDVNAPFLYYVVKVTAPATGGTR
jgi:glc operon protein GlcG